MVADGHMKVGFAHLVYLELDVTVAGAPAYQVRTGELLTPAATGTSTPGRELVVKVDPDATDSRSGTGRTKFLAGRGRPKRGTPACVLR